VIALMPRRAALAVHFVLTSLFASSEINMKQVAGI
jgi:hypothetical protein